MTVLSFLRDVWHGFQPLRSFLLPLAACVAFYLLNSRNKTFKQSSKITLVLIFVYSAYLFAKIIVHSITTPTVWDFTAFYLYGKVAAAGYNFYLPENFQHVFYSLQLPALDYSEFIRESVNVGFFYPPPTIFLFIILGFLTYKTALFCWIIFILLFALADVYLIYDLFFKSYKVYGVFFVGILFFLFPSVNATFFFGQTSFILLVLLLLMKKYENIKFAGILLTLSFFVKPYMGAFGLIFLIRKQWTTLLYALVSGLVICIITILTFGMAPFQSYLFDNAAKRLPTAAFSEDINQSLQAVLLRQHLISLDAPFVYALIAAAIFLLTTLYLFYLQKKELYEYIWAILLVVTLIIYPGTLNHYGVMMLFIIFQFFDSKQIKWNKYPNLAFMGLLYYLNPDLFGSLCILLGILFLRSLYQAKYPIRGLGTA